MILIGRSPERLDPAVAWLAGQMPGAAVETIVADLSSLAQTRRAAGMLADRMAALDVLVNNAGVLCPRRVETAEGHELTLAVNHLSPYVLTAAALPLLQAAPAGRVVMVGSSSSDRAAIDPDDLELRRGWFMSRAYARSKLALLMTSLETAAEVRPAGLTVNVVHPGFVATSLVRSGGVVQLAWKALAAVALTPEQGAEAPLHAALSPSLAGTGGLYLKRRGAVTPNRRALDPALRARVMAATRALV